MPTEAELTRVRDIMVIYRDSPCDLADASLLTTAETLAAERIFTLDGHFHAYRLANGKVLEVVP